MALKHRAIDPETGMAALSEMYDMICEAEQELTKQEERERRMAGRSRGSLADRFPVLKQDGRPRDHGAPGMVTR